ncbi:MAG: hypothetical protein ACK4FB_13420 [Brevundimonas sp.]|uniref:hypothetical protein n=1 Tax=Brevundimonas sp. TaxID=1871086 RepID=UPI00391DF3EC
MSGDVTEVEGITIVGQRRSEPGQSFPSQPPPFVPPIFDEIEPVPPEDPGPCDTPETRREWNADAAAAKTAKEFVDHAAARNPSETLNHREWGAALFEMPDGTIVRGTITHSQYTFQNPGPSGRVSVPIDWTAPAGGVLIGMIHSHNAGSHLPSGSSPDEFDLANLAYIRDLRTFLGLNPDDARIYIVALTTGPAGHESYAKITVYDHTNQEAAIQDEEGPEVNPDAQPCPL